MNWFNQNGDKLLAGAAATISTLAQSGVISPTATWAGAAVGVLAMLHTLFWPNNPGQPTITGGTK